MAEIILYHASTDIVEFPGVKKSKYPNDFSWGFYCTKSYDQAKRSAKKIAGTPVINKYIFTPREDLSILQFPVMNDEWLNFIASCRSGEIHGFDIVEGPMVDDSAADYVNSFLHGTLDRENFWSLAKSMQPAHQMSFHTIKALDCLSFVGSVNLDE